MHFSLTINTDSRSRSTSCLSILLSAGNTDHILKFVTGQLTYLNLFYNLRKLNVLIWQPWFRLKIKFFTLCIVVQWCQQLNQSHFYKEIRKWGRASVNFDKKSTISLMFHRPTKCCGLLYYNMTQTKKSVPPPLVLPHPPSIL